MKAERLAVVTCDDEQRVVRETESVNCANQLADDAVCGLHPVELFLQPCVARAERQRPIVVIREMRLEGPHR
jgi:hypothetical protein